MLVKLDFHKERFVVQHDGVQQSRNNRTTIAQQSHNNRTTITQQSHNNRTTIAQQAHNNRTTIAQQSHNNRTTIAQQSHNNRTTVVQQPHPQIRLFPLNIAKPTILAIQNVMVSNVYIIECLHNRMFT